MLAGEPPKRILQIICEQSVEIFDAGSLWIGQKERDGRIRMPGAAGSAGHYRDELERIGIRRDDDALAAGPGGQAIRTGRTVHTAGTIQWANEALAIPGKYALEELIDQSPNILKSGKHDRPYYDRLWQTVLKGEMWIDETIERNVRGENYIVRQTITSIPDEAGEIACFVAIHHDITERKQTEEKIRRLAHYDSLTGVPNRALFFDRLHQAISLGERHHRRFALLYLDLDGFKPVNDLYGHRCGDAVLRISAGRIAGQVRSNDTVARLGGDEFAILLHDVTEEHAAHRIAENVIEAVSAPMNAEGQQIEIAVSIGIAFFPHSGRDADALIHEADRAMYEAKRAGKKTIRTAAFQNR